MKYFWLLYNNICPQGKASWQEDGSVIVEGNLDGANMVTVR